jgi:uroporphyrinogen-III synthase
MRDNQVMAPDPLMLITRSGEPGRALCARVKALGFNAVHCSPVELTGPADPEATAARLAASLPADRVIITSPEGIRQAMALVGRDSMARCLVIVPGPGSAGIAREFGLERVLCPSRGANSEAMLALQELDDVKGSRILILAAAGGRRLLEKALTERGAQVERVHVYRRLQKALPDGLEQSLAQASPVITLASSAGALEGLHDQLSAGGWNRLAQGLMIVPSERVAELARMLDCQQVRTADGADDEAMLKCLD